MKPSDDNTKDTTSGNNRRTLDDSILVGMDAPRAVALVSDYGLVSRITQINGEGQIGTCDFDTSRVNLSIVDGVVIATDRG